jgi:HPt (histidine-containing phosphotransfer) domain-containing protein
MNGGTVRTERLRKKIERVTMQSQSKNARVHAHKVASPNTHWNSQQLLERLDNDRAFLSELLSIFRQDSQTALQEAKESLAKADLAAVERKAHTLKGITRNLLMHRAAQTASGLEAAARERNAVESTALLAQLEQTLQELMPEVDALMLEIKR